MEFTAFTSHLLRISLFHSFSECDLFVLITCPYLPPTGLFSDRLHQVLRLRITYLAKTNYLYNNCDITFLTMFILNHPDSFPCGRKSERPETTHDFRQSVDRLFSHESIAGIELTFSEVKGACCDADCATEAPNISALLPPPSLPTTTISGVIHGVIMIKFCF
jgi:hypothetical protein